MFRIKLCFLLVFLSAGNPLFAQKLVHVPSENYSDVDDHILTLAQKQFANTDSLAAELATFKKTHLKLRAVYRWVATNIVADVVGIKNPKKGIDKPNDVLKYKKATPLGYANLVNALCEKLSIPCEVVAGFSRTAYSPAGVVVKDPNHYWNTVKMYNKWYLLDAFMGSGTLDKKANVFTQKYNDIYFVPNPRQFILNHLPMRADKQYLDTLIDKKTFFSYPVVYNGFFQNGVYALTPADGNLKIKQGQTKKMSFKLIDSLIVDNIEIYDRKLKTKENVPFSQSGNIVSFTADFKKPKKQMADIFVNGKMVASYRLYMRKTDEE